MDDYKESHRDSRRDFINFASAISMDDVPYEKIVSASQEFTKDYMLEVKGGVISPNSFGKFLDSIKMNTTFTWDMRSSEYFLTMKMLADSKALSVDDYTVISGMVFAELAANSEVSFERPRSRRLLLASDGRNIDNPREFNEPEMHIGAQVGAFASSLNWIALRTCFYTYLSSVFDAYSCLHPIRSAFQLSLADELGVAQDSSKSIIKMFSNEADSVHKIIRKNSDPIVVDMRIPLFSAWIISKSDNPLDGIEVALSLKDDKPFTEIRHRLSELDEIDREQNNIKYIKEINSISEDISSTCRHLIEEFGVKTANGVPIAPLVGVMNLAAQLNGAPEIPASGIKVAIPSGVKALLHRRGFKLMTRSVVRDLSAVSKLGSLHDRLTSMAVYRNEDGERFRSKVEDQKFFGKASFWKRPM